MTDAVDEILELYAARGACAYVGEPVSSLAHALQAAHFAIQDRAPAPLVAAALLHDVGHLLDPVPEDLADWQVDARHELTGSRWLARRFRSEVTDPVRLHVAAKRYLCATSPRYAATLSPASVATLALQGGPMSEDEQQRFRIEPGFREALRVRLWDDRAKVEDLAVAPLADYRALLEGLLRPSG